MTEHRGVFMRTAQPIKVLGPGGLVGLHRWNSAWTEETESGVNVASGNLILDNIVACWMRSKNERCYFGGAKYFDPDPSAVKCRLKLDRHLTDISDLSVRSSVQTEDKQ
jgi:hypothetical protein